MTSPTAEERANRIPCEACDSGKRHVAAADGVNCPRLIGRDEIRALKETR
jgi:hypothetical protein